MSTRRLIISAAVGLAIVAGVISYGLLPSRHAFQPEVRIQTEDYTQVRSHFHTRLLRAAPSLQRDVFALRPPDYVDEIEYPSGGLRLKAWIAGHRDARQR